MKTPMDAVIQITTKIAKVAENDSRYYEIYDRLVEIIELAEDLGILSEDTGNDKEYH